MPLDRSIPAFYCCYLLRSTVRHSGVYIGSTPNPVRRLRQHNGDAKGGAARTNRENLRPWEMACIVTGFPSHIAALQFEWAWQNPHITLHIPAECRIQRATQKKRSGQPKRPRHSVASLLSNLHLLLRVPSFSRLPLEVRFFCSDVHKAWLKWSNLASEPIREPLNIVQDFPPHEHTASDSQAGSPSRKKRKVGHGIAELDVGYANLKPYVEKAKGVIDFEREGACAVCHEDLERDAGIYTICPNPECEVVTHMTCLSKHFLKDEENALVPVTGTCPSCKAKLRWIDVVKELSLRMRGQKEVEKLLKKKRARKAKAVASSQAVLESSDIEEDADYEAVEKEFEQEIMMIQELNPDTHGFDMGDSWHAIDDSDDSDTGSNFSNTSKIGDATSYQAGKAGELGTEVLDTDWDDAEVLD